MKLANETGPTSTVTPGAAADRTDQTDLPDLFDLSLAGRLTRVPSPGIVKHKKKHKRTFQPQTGGVPQ
jgi:hypothetical protein